MYNFLRRFGPFHLALFYIILAALLGIALEWIEVLLALEPGPQLDGLHFLDNAVLISITTVALYLLLRALLSEHHRERMRHAHTQQAYQQLFRAHPQPMCLIDPTSRRFVDVNQAAVTRYGWSREEFLSMRVDDVQYSEATGSLDHHFSVFLDPTPGPKSATKCHKDRDGNPFWVEITTHPVEFDNTPMLLVTSVDITTQVEAVRKAKKTLKHLEDAEQLGRFGAWEWHAGDTHMRISRGLARLFGIPPEQQTESLDSAFRRIVPEDRPHARAAAETCLQTGQAEIRFRAQLPNGEIRHYREILHAQSGNGTALMMTGSVIDETDQIRHTRALERQEADLRKILINLPAPVVLHDIGPGGKLHLANPAFYCMLGVPAGQESRIEELAAIAADTKNRQRLDDLLDTIGEHGNHQRKQEVLLKRQDHSIFRVHINSTHLQLAERQYAQLVIHDIDEEIVLREQLRQANQKLSMLNSKTLRVLEQERALISRELHDDIGQLLIAVKTNLRSLYNKWPADLDKPPEADLISGVLEELVAKVRDRSLMLRPPQLDELGLKHAISWEMRRMIGPTGIQREFHDRVVNDKLPDEPSLTAFRIFQEAMTNAIRHGEPDHLAVTLEADAEQLRITIVDDGKGFDPEENRGGLGLANMTERASLVAGMVTVSSSPGNGTRVEAVLPLRGHRVTSPA
ncbi:PAS domain S-box protein [Marinobacter sp.]|uniref:sensor histidine kinase n=1 Tax=Marinobacter sp. TaxID=50741 RepID=UPI00258C4713|nr:PAS domain S-box protein [Marinobacter sp.]MCW9009151.1 PAS domain S-box protein [Marinobacter sp.]